MKNTVITKNIDDLGRIVLPKDIRKKLGMEIRSSVDHESSGFVYFLSFKIKSYRLQRKKDLSKLFK